MNNFLHNLSHKFNPFLNGHVIAFYISKCLYIGFQCEKCGDIIEASKSTVDDLKPNKIIIDEVYEKLDVQR